MEQDTFERPVDNRRFLLALSASASATIIYFAVAARAELWMAVPIGLAHLVGLFYLLIRRPSSAVIIEPHTIHWHGDGLFFHTANSVAFIEIASVDLCTEDRHPRLILRNRFSEPWIIRGNCFEDGIAILDSIRRFRPSMPMKAHGQPYPPSRGQAPPVEG
ncbi:MAG: hypothetical protein AAGJ40_08910 [Planctomycetota bacterium]